jgi:hypothetical protein
MVDFIFVITGNLLKWDVNSGCGGGLGGISGGRDIIE